MKAFIALSYQHRHSLDKTINSVEETLHSLGYDTVEVFVRRQHNGLISNRELMKQALDGIETSDLMVAEITHKAVGVGIEVGHAHACSIPIIGIRKSGSASSTTLEGVLSIPPIEYSSEADIPWLLQSGITNLSDTRNESRLKELNQHELALLDYVMDSARSILAEINKTEHSAPTFELVDSPNNRDEKRRLLQIAREYSIGLRMNDPQTQERFWSLFTSDLSPLSNITDEDRIGLSRGETPFQIALMSVDLALAEHIRSEFPDSKEFQKEGHEVIRWLWNRETPRHPLSDEITLLMQKKPPTRENSSRRIS